MLIKNTRANSSACRRKSGKPKIFFLNLGYYLSREIPNALEELQCPFLDFQPRKMGENVTPDLFLRQTISAILRYKPDMVLTVNALGLDNAGAMAQFLERCKIPLAVWFVDNPELFFIGGEKMYPDNTVFFTCDPDAAQKIARISGPTTHYLPLAVDKGSIQQIKKTNCRSISFVGDTWTEKIAACYKNHALPRFFLLNALALARALADHQPGDGRGFVQKKFSHVYDQAVTTLSAKNQNGFWHLVYWQANKLYRKDCVARILPFNALIAGDKYWKQVFSGQTFEYHPPIAYGTEVCKLYGLSKINFACSSIQMAGAVTQRVFDVPAAGGFVLTDERKQLEELFDVGREAVCYSCPEEIGTLVERYLHDEKERVRIIKAARRRIAAEHTYTHRMQILLNIVGERL